MYYIFTSLHPNPGLVNTLIQCQRQACPKNKILDNIQNVDLPNLVLREVVTAQDFTTHFSDTFAVNSLEDHDSLISGNVGILKSRRTRSSHFTSGRTIHFGKFGDTFFPTFGDGFMFARLLWFQEMYAKFAKLRSQVWWECMMIRLFFNTF